MIVKFLAVFSLFLQIIPFLKIDSKVYPQKLAPGKSATLYIYISPYRADVLLYSFPPLKVYITKKDSVIFSKDFYTAFDLKLIEEGQQNKSLPLRLRKPLAIPFTVAEEVSPGRHVIRGEVEFAVCSIKEPWCVKTRQPFEAIFIVKSYIRRRR